MESTPAPGETLVSASGDAPRVTVRYWAAIKSAAGVGQEEVVGSTVGAVLEAARDRHAADPEFARVLGVCSLLLDERPLRADPATVSVADGDVLDVLPPFAGG